MADLAPYAAAAALTMAPSFLFGRVFNPVALPVLARVQHDSRAFDRRYGLIIAVISVFSAAYSVGMILGAEAIMRLVYGQKYAGSGIILGWLAAANSFRNVRIAPAIAAMARGDSMNQMLSNLARVLALAPALAVALAGQPVWMIACAGLSGEALACLVSFRRLAALQRVPFARNLRPAALVATAVLLAGGATVVGAHQLRPLLSLCLAVVGAALAGGVALVALEDTRREAQRFVEQFQRVGWRGWLSSLSGDGPDGKPADP
jgi:O-antigen/teichoic acid export membrane protein